MAVKRFSNQQSAESFAKRVNGIIKDLRKVKGAKSKFTVNYEVKINDRCPEEDRDFGYPNDYWK
jgi:hypothetical protein